MKIDWTDVTYSGKFEWMFTLGWGKGAEHWQWFGGSDFRFGTWAGDKLRSSDYDFRSCDTVATTYESSSRLYTLYSDLGESQSGSRRRRGHDMDRQSARTRASIV